MKPKSRAYRLTTTIFQIEPDAGSENPFRAGVPLDTQRRTFTVLATPSDERSADNSVNRVRIPGGRLINVIMYRVYRPHTGVTLTRADLPRVHARSRLTGETRKCPVFAERPVRWHFPQVLADAYARFTDFSFRNPGDIGFLGLNQASGYTYALTELRNDEVALVKFRAPSFIETAAGTGPFKPEGKDVRYWSLCTANLPNNEGLACATDVYTQVRQDGFVYVVVGPNSVAGAAASLGYTFVPDLRSQRQHVIAFAYRNLLASSAFAPTMMQGEYLPVGRICEINTFTEGKCGW